MKNTITILALFFSLLAAHAKAIPVQPHESCDDTSQVIRGIVTSISELRSSSKLHKSTYTIGISSVLKHDELDELTGEKPYYSELRETLTYDANSEVSITTYNLLKKSYTYVTSVVVTACGGKRLKYYAQGENILLPDRLITEESSQIISAENHSQRNNPLDIAPGYNPEATWHSGRVLKVTRYHGYTTLQPMCKAVVEATENTVNVMPEKHLDIDLLPERLVYQVTSEGMCRQLEGAVSSPSSVEFQFEGGCTPERNMKGWIKAKELLRCRRKLSALRGVET